MTFSVYDPYGYRIPYDPRSEWRKLNRADPSEALKYTKKDRYKEAKEQRRAFSLVQERQEKEFTGRDKRYQDSNILVASQIMSHTVALLSPESEIREAWDLFTKKRYRHIPVINSEGKLVGIVSDRTLLKLLQFEENHMGTVQKSTIAEIMVSPVLTAGPNTDVREIARIFIDERVGAMPIVDHDKLVGILTRSDILRTQVKMPFLDLRG